MHTSPSACRTNMLTMRRGCITTSLGTMSLMWVVCKPGPDPHEFKANYVCKRAVSYYDVYKQNKTGELLLRRKNSSEFIRTRIGCDDAE